MSAVLLVLLALVAVGLVGVARSCATAGAGDAAETGQAQDGRDPDSPASDDAGVPVAVWDAGRVTGSGAGRVSLCAVGDNLANENVLELARSWSDDGSYDFAPLYRDVRPVVTGDYDIGLVNQETEMGGTDSFGYLGYPSYNTPDSMAAAIADAGFRVVNCNTNHTYDTWVGSILHEQALWESYPAVMTIGSYASEEDRATVRVMECNGVRIAFLSYSYGQNGYEQSDLPNDYYAVPYTEDGMATDVARARRVADAVVVYMHWGTEYTNVPSDEQREFARYAADDGVDLVVGSHAHVIQPMEWLERADGGRTLVAYGLGDFVSGYHDNPDCVLSGMLSCDFVRGNDGSVSIGDVVWHPLVEHWEGSDDHVCLLRDYSADMARNNELLAGLDDPLGWCRGKTEDVIGDGFAIDM